VSTLQKLKEGAQRLVAPTQVGRFRDYELYDSFIETLGAKPGSMPTRVQVE
jgi:hypothetical protein